MTQHLVCPLCDQGFCFDFAARRVTCGCSTDGKPSTDVEQHTRSSGEGEQAPHDDRRREARTN